MPMFVFLLLACVTERSFPGQVVSVACARSEECFKSDFESSYDSQRDCVDEEYDSFEHIGDCYSEHCTFDPSDAGDYLSELRRAECDAVSEALADFGGVYDDCEDELGLFACLAGF